MRVARNIGRQFLKGAFVLAFALACAGRASAQLDADGRWENGVTESWWLDGEAFTDAEKLNAASLWKSIGEANARDAADARAGDYFRGYDTAGTYMRWSPRAGFVIADVNKCEARVRAIIYGRVEVTPTLVSFIPEFYKVQPRRRNAGGEGGQQQEAEAEQQKAAATPEVMRYVPVEWRGRRMLIAEDEMEEFGDYLAGLGRYNGVPHLIYYESDWTEFFSLFVGGGPAPSGAGSEASDDPGETKDSAAGEPDEPAAEEVAPPVVPPGYERFLKKPVEATVTAVGRRSVKRNYALELNNNSLEHEHASVTRVTINAGTAHGVKDRTVFRVVEPDEGDIVVILRAGENESEAVVVRELDERGAETFYENSSDRVKKHSKVAAGWKLTTNPF